MRNAEAEIEQHSVAVGRADRVRIGSDLGQHASGHQSRDVTGKGDHEAALPAAVGRAGSLERDRALGRVSFDSNRSAIAGRR